MNPKLSPIPIVASPAKNYPLEGIILLKTNWKYIDLFSIAALKIDAHTAPSNPLNPKTVKENVLTIFDDWDCSFYNKFDKHWIAPAIEPIRIGHTGYTK